MRTEIIEGITVLYASEGKIIALDGEPLGPEVWLGVNDTRTPSEIDPPVEEPEPDIIPEGLPHDN